MGKHIRWNRRRYLSVVVLLALVVCGCQKFLRHLSNNLTHWNMLGNEAMEDPLKAVGGVGFVYLPMKISQGWSHDKLKKASVQELVEYYSPIVVQQRPNGTEKTHSYPPEYDEIGQAFLKPDGQKFKAYVAGAPKLYAIYQKVIIAEKERIQLTYTAWYPAHPRMKLIDLESADIDSCVLRITLDTDYSPLFYETIAACGCFHKVFVAGWLESDAAKQYGTPEPGKKFVIEKKLEDGIDWEVAGVIDTPRDRPCRPVVFIKAGDHKVIGMGSSAKLRMPSPENVKKYELVDYQDLYAVPVDGSTQKQPFFNLGKGGTVWGAQRKERFIFGMFGVNNAGQPRANDHIKLHFDESSWDDVTTFQRYLRLPTGSL